MLVRDRLAARLAEMGGAPDYRKLAEGVLGIRNAPESLARRLVSQALVVEDRLEEWRRIGERICAGAPRGPGVYVLRDATGCALYVGKANNLRRRLRTHFSARRWRALKPAFARAAAAEWREVGSELEALLREADWIATLTPSVNVQAGLPVLDARALPRRLVRDVVVVLPSVEKDSAELIGARVDGGWIIQQTRRDGTDLVVHASRLMRFFLSPIARRTEERLLAPIVFSWLNGRGQNATRIDPHDCGSARALRTRLSSLLADSRVFDERIVMVDSVIGPSRRPAARLSRP
jgi:hypothetical protein